MIRIMALAFAAAASCAAQEKITVPLSNPGQPVMIKVNRMVGSITVRGGAGTQVTVTSEAQRAARERTPERSSDIPPGMHRIDSGRDGLNIDEDHNVITISGGWGRGDITIEAPANTSVQLKTMSAGSIEVSGITGDIDVQDMTGAITLKNVSGAVVAHALNGAITASFDRVPPDKPMSFTSMNGKIEVTLPADTKARLRLKTDNGSIYTDFDVKLEATKPAIEDSRSSDGRYRVRMEKALMGTINGGGPEYLFQTMNGNILIHKK